MSSANNTLDQLKAENNRLSNDLRTSMQMNELLLKYRSSVISYLNECHIGGLHQSCGQTSDLIRDIERLELIYRPLRQEIRRIFLSDINKTIECVDTELMKNGSQQMSHDVMINNISAIQDLATRSGLTAQDHYSSNSSDNSVDIGVDRPEKTIRCEVKGCVKCFSSRNSLSIHIHRYHKNANTFECRQCKKCFAFRSLLRKHKMSCNQRTDIRPHLRTNANNAFDMALVDSNSYQLNCNQLAHSMRQQPMDSFSNDSHSENTDQSCDSHQVIICEANGCVRRLSSRNSLNIHLSRFHKNCKSFQCFQCKQCFADRLLLRHHQSVTKCKQTITGDHMVGDEYISDNVVEDNSVYLEDKHQTGGHHKRYVCEVKDCDKRLVSQNSLNIHISRYHKNANCFECFQCKQCFTDRPSLRHHQTTSH